MFLMAQCPWWASSILQWHIALDAVTCNANMTLANSRQGFVRMPWRHINDNTFMATAAKSRPAPAPAHEHEALPFGLPGYLQSIARP